ncbi:MAG TPA: hypothetical protein VF665_02020 [Longimicrobium sp.]|jgi:hypothetical protein|uniref:hypothetical protein n=1 Tax=Longimicrobium sp. TaxID=2029185 RepID=UPI002EDA22D7
MASDLKHPGGRSGITGRIFMALVILGLIVFFVWFGWTHREKNDGGGGMLGSLPAPSQSSAVV